MTNERPIWERHNIRPEYDYVVRCVRDRINPCQPLIDMRDGDIDLTSADEVFAVATSDLGLAEDIAYPLSLLFDGWTHVSDMPFHDQLVACRWIMATLPLVN